MAEKLVTGSLVPAGYPPGLQAPPLPKMYPPRPPQPPAPEGAPRGCRPRPPLLPAASGFEAGSPPPTALPPHPGAGNAPAPAGPGAGRSPRGRFPPHPSAPAPHPRDPPRRCAAAAGLHNPAGDRERAAADRGRQPAVRERADAGDPGHPARPRRAPLRHPSPPRFSGPGVGDRNRLPTWRTGSGPARRREHSSRAGSGGAGPGRRPRSEPQGQTGGPGARKASQGGNDPREGVPTAPQTGNPKATGGLGVADFTQLCPTTLSPPPARVSRRHPSRDSLGLPELHPEAFRGGWVHPQLQGPLWGPHWASGR